MRTPIAAVAAASLLGACAADPIVVPTAVGRPSHEVAQLVAGSEARVFPCAFERVADREGKALEIGRLRSDVTLPPGRYLVTLHCTNGAGHKATPSAQVDARAGKRYRVSGYFIDDSITMFNMKMAVRVTEMP